jgi:thioredoxin-like negative regulator of GroEL
MSEITVDLESGRNGLAARKLDALLAWRPDSDEAVYLLGQCERERGRTEAALEAWARIPGDSPFAQRACQGRVELEIQRGRLADAELLVNDAIYDPRSDAAGLSLVLGTIYSLQGRVSEAERFIEARWDQLNRAGEGASESAISLVRLHIELPRTRTPVETIREFLKNAGGSAPEDDRVWLGKANLAIRTGSYDEAARWLGACVSRRPDDAAVWRARLNWAVATLRVPEVRAALEHLPASESTTAELQALLAWFAAQRGDRTAERRALERLVTADPADFAGVDRLVELAMHDGQQTRVAELRRKRSEMDQLGARYLELHERHQPKRDAAEMADLAARLGRQFEANAFLTVAAAVDRHVRSVDIAAFQRQANADGAIGLTLARLLAPELGVDPGPSSSAIRAPAPEGRTARAP